MTLRIDESSSPGFIDSYFSKIEADNIELCKLLVVLR